MEDPIKLIKRKYRLNYIARFAWSVATLVFIWKWFSGPLLWYNLVHLALTTLWIIFVETESRVIYIEELRYIRIAMDSFLYTIVIYITGGIYSFCLLSYIIFVIMASLYTTRRYGIFAIGSCLLFYNAMLYLMHTGTIPYANILARGDITHVKLTLFQVVFTNFVLILVSVVMHSVAFSLYRNLMERTAELRIERNRLQERNLIIEKDLKLAKRIQNQLIPQKSARPFLHAMYMPMDEVGGDFYDFIEFRAPSKIGIFISDVSGHGVPAAFITSMIKTILLQSGQMREDPSAILMNLNGTLYGKTAENFITAFYCIYDEKSRSLFYSNAGHNPPFILKENRIEKISEPRSIPLAIADNEFLLQTGKNYTNATITLSPGDSILLYTDGLTEQKGGDGIHETFEDLMMEDILSKLRGYSSQQVITQLSTRLLEWGKKDRLSDDVCILCLNVQ